ncbi:MAG: nucleotidyltransferase family protein [Kiritimatiellae bacterium]|nr:nucleotidyltransferase family protein [Kiritimatiellia bacterium]
MKPTVLDLLREELAELRGRYGVVRIGVFGSCIRGEAHPGSDVDVLVEFAKPGFDVYMDLKFHLEDLLHRPVDLVTVSAVKPLLRDKILREVAYAA